MDDPGLGDITFSPGGEEWIEYGPPDARRRIAFHDYAALYSVPGLYERVFVQELDMTSADVVVGLYGQALAQLGLDPAGQRALDFGAGNGMAGERLARLGVPFVVGLDLEPAAREAAFRDRPGIYADYVVTDLATAPPGELADLRSHDFTAVLAVSAVGPGHVPPDVLGRALDLLAPGGLFAFPLAVELLGDDAPAPGFRGFFDELWAAGRAEKVLDRSYVHRFSADGSEQRALAVVGRVA